MLDYVWLILLFPLAGVLINAFVGRWLGRRAVAAVASLAVGASFVVAAIVLVQMLGVPAEIPDGENARRWIIPLFTWIVSGDLVVEARILLDQLSILMVLVVTGVSLLIHIYSAGYMKGEEYYNRYFAWLNLFVFMMLILVLSDSFVTMFIGWEGVGLCSYLLIGYWFEKEPAAEAGKKAFIVNRVGDFGFLLAILLIFATFGSVAFEDVFSAAGTILPATATAIALLLFLGATGKSAQIPLYVWLPDAMEGPTPVSALIHAATMVTAGVYMVARCHTLFEQSATALNWVAWIGAITAFFAATMAVVQKDFKRVLAYSTISQLGYMFMAAGVGAYAAGIFHLTTHAFFKALLFLGAGSVIHALSGEQDIFKMGGLRKLMPWTFGAFLVGVLALAGVPGFSGFFSKDQILISDFVSGGPLLWLVGIVTAGLTAFYAFRLLFVAFYGKPRMDKRTLRQVHEAAPVMIVPMVILALFAAFVGYLGLPAGLGVGHAIDIFLAPVFADTTLAQHAAASPALEWGLTLTSVLVAGAGILAAYWIYVRRWGLAARMTKNARWLYDIIDHKYYVDEAYDEVFVKPLRALAAVLADVVEPGIDGSVDGLGRLTSLAGEGLRRLQTGLVRNYALAMLAGVVAVLAYFVVRGLLGW
ncbi:NADH-quinone oxidoreductase subunit L [Chloroflexota bacterium]